MLAILKSVSKINSDPLQKAHCRAVRPCQKLGVRDSATGDEEQGQWFELRRYRSIDSFAIQSEGGCSVGEFLGQWRWKCEADRGISWLELYAAYVQQRGPPDEGGRGGHTAGELSLALRKFVRSVRVFAQMRLHRDDADHFQQHRVRPALRCLGFCTSISVLPLAPEWPDALRSSVSAMLLRLRPG
eukprot:10092746-Alexandrium_andersonii.AAC.1